MDIDQFPILRNWPVVVGTATVTPVAHSIGFSGARVWRVAVGDQVFALRCWQPQMRRDQLDFIHVVQSVLGAYGPPVIPRLQKTKAGLTMAVVKGRLWELATWRPGTADFHARPTSARLTAAMQALGEIHQAANQRIATPWPIRMEAGLGRDVARSERSQSKSASRREKRLDELITAAGLAALRAAAAKAPAELDALAREGVALIEKRAPQELAQARLWQQRDLPLQYRLGDVHHDHVLFVNDEVTGVIDFGAVDFDAPAGDVARLLGSLVGEDRDRWRDGLAAYEAVRPMTDVEREAVAFFNSSGLVISVANWLQWLWPSHPMQAPPLHDRDAALARFSQLVERLRGLVERNG